MSLSSVKPDRLLARRLRQGARMLLQHDVGSSILGAGAGRCPSSEWFGRPNFVAMLAAHLQVEYSGPSVRASQPTWISLSAGRSLPVQRRRRNAA
jgi:hypothetical protein